jgi:putative component of membrane protein insertase Oxa1/YidC/SpoIIIJ protein YidD
MRDVTQFIDSPYCSKGRYSRGWTFRKLLPLLDRPLRSIAISLIGGYQRHLSPRKGYSCAHRVVHGGNSCSEYIKNALADKSLFETTLLAKQRFKECNLAYISSKSQNAHSNGSAGFDPDIFQCIMGIVAAILALIFGRNNGCCK